MRIVLIVILIDLVIFTLGAFFADEQHKIYECQKKPYGVDHYGYYWIVEE